MTDSGVRGMVFNSWSGWCGVCQTILDIPTAARKRQCEDALKKLGWTKLKSLGWICEKCAAKLAKENTNA